MANTEIYFWIFPKSPKCLLLFYEDKQNQEADKSLLKEAFSVPESAVVVFQSNFSSTQVVYLLKGTTATPIIYLPIHALTKLLC